MTKQEKILHFWDINDQVIPCLFYFAALSQLIDTHHVKLSSRFSPRSLISHTNASQKISRAEETYSLYLNLPILNANIAVTWTSVVRGGNWMWRSNILTCGTWAMFFHENSFASSTAATSGSTVVITRAAMIYQTNFKRRRKEKERVAESPINSSCQTDACCLITASQ